MLLDGLSVVLVKTRFPENIGMVARASANMGCPSIRLVDPERWDRDKAAPLATAKGLPLLDSITSHAHLGEALADSALVIGTTARTGGWRRGVQSPARAAALVAAALAKGQRVSLVFGPEDRGLNNEEITPCHHLVTIPTAEASSLNLAQAVLLVLYECATAMRRLSSDAQQEQLCNTDNAERGGRSITSEEQERLMGAWKTMLLSLDYLHGDNPEYFLLPWRRLFGRAALRRHEYDALMGLCRQVAHKIH